LRRAERRWTGSAVTLAESGGDIRALVAQPLAIAPVVSAGRALIASARASEGTSLSEAASRHCQAGIFLGRAGLTEEQESARRRAFECVRLAVESGISAIAPAPKSRCAARNPRAATVTAPPRIDLAGGWSDTPPFCLDWGGTVLNIAVELNGGYPIRSSVRPIADRVIRITSEGEGDIILRTAQELFATVEPGSAWSIPRLALSVLGLIAPGCDLAAIFDHWGCGLEIRTAVDLPLGSGLGTSSILAAAVVRALAAAFDIELTDQELSDRVMVLEQRMTTGGGWQDQAGGIFPGAKLISSGPGLRQRIRVQPLTWSAGRQAEFSERAVLYYTGIRRVAKDLLHQVVGSYLAREVATVQVLHSIKTLAMEMAYALQEGEWDYAGSLLDRHWKLNQVLDPHTTNGPINALLDLAAPYISGAKLAGAGGGGFLILLARDPDAAVKLRARLASHNGAGALYDFKVANGGIAVRE
jgi:galactokinase/mevalonate kinase-like predicted kinase